MSSNDLPEFCPSCGSKESAEARTDKKMAFEYGNVNYFGHLFTSICMDCADEYLRARSAIFTNHSSESMN